MQGYIKLHRKTTSWEWYDHLPTFKLFLHLLLTVNFEDRKWRGLTIKKGQRLCSRKQLAAECGLSEQQVRTALNNLQSTNEITIKSAQQGTEITVNNYVEHQQSTNESTNDQPTINQRSTNDQPVNKNDKNDKNNTPPIDISNDISIFPPLNRGGKKKDNFKKLGDDWWITDAQGDWAYQEFMWPKSEIIQAADEFKDHHLANGTVQSDWDAAWRKWCRIRQNQLLKG